MFKLVISDDEGKTTVVPLVREEVSIGRKEGNTIRLTERNVSRKHASLRRVNGGGFQIEDLNSYNGVQLNGRRIAAPTPLEPGDKVIIGDYVLALEAEPAPVVDDAPTEIQPMGPPPRLVMLSAPAPGAEFALTRDGIRLGRAEDLDIWINHRSISREHAEVRLAGDEVFIRDLESANGMRVNGQQIREHALRAGDVIELGQVRFRFVAAGEVYVFEADSTLAVDAIAPETVLPTEKPKTTKYVAIGLVLLAIVVGALIAIPATDDPVQDEVIPTTPTVASSATDPSAPPTAERSADVLIAEAVAECERSYDAGAYEDARAAAGRALARDPSSESAQRCLAATNTAARDRELFERGVGELEANQPIAAFATFTELTPDGRYSERPEIARARDAYVAARLASAEAMAPSDLTGAQEIAGELLARDDLSRRERDRADAIFTSSDEPSDPTPPPSRSPSMRRATMTTTSTMTSVAVMEASTTSMTTAVSTTTAMSAPSDPAAYCLGMGNFNQCIVDALGGGRARDARSLGLLIESYRRLGRRPDEVRAMNEFIRRYPNHSRAPTYRRLLSN